MINHNRILQLLKQKKFTQTKIAKICNCSVSTVRRIARKHDLLPGQGNIRFWKEPEISPELAYIIGMFLTDGSIGFAYKTKKPRQLIIVSTTKEICDKLLLCYSAINIPTKLNGPYKQINPHHKDQFVVAVYWSKYAEWILDITDDKNKIPNLIINGPFSYLAEFLAGVIDGDGSVSVEGTIRIRNVQGWLADLPKVLKKLDIRTGGYKKLGTKPLITGKDYYNISIRRSDFIKYADNIAHPIKKYRIFNPKWRKRKYKYRSPQERKRMPKVKCPICKIKRMHYTAKHCQYCYRESEQFYKHLKSIAKKGNHAGNIARWGTNHLNKHN